MFKQDQNREQMLRRYLLGELGEQEQSPLEERYFGDARSFDDLVLAEDELIDAYVSGSLSPREREHFEHHFLRSPDRRERVEFAISLSEFASKHSKRNASSQSEPRPQTLLGFLPRSWAVFIPPTAALLLTIGVAWLLIDTMRLRSEVQRSLAQREAIETERAELRDQLGQQRSRSEQLQSELEKERNLKKADQTGGRNLTAGIVSFLLTASGARGSGSLKTLVIEPETEWVKLKIGIPRSDHNSFNATLATAAGVEVRSVTGLRAEAAGSRSVIAVKLHASDFRNEVYILTFNGITSTGSVDLIGEYPFTVRKK